MSYQNRIKEIDDEIAALHKKRNATLQEWAKVECSVKVGDVVPCKGIGYTKYEGKKLQITHITATWEYPRWYWVAYGPVLKKDGTPGVNTGEWSERIGEPI